MYIDQGITQTTAHGFIHFLFYESITRNKCLISLHKNTRYQLMIVPLLRTATN
jgi:hypothetical protein